MSSAPGDAQAGPARMAGREFIAFIAISMAVGAMATDLMLPALHAINEDLGLAGANRSQAVIVAFFLGMGVPQLVFGPLSDRYGRRSLFLGGLLVFVVGSLMAALAGDFSWLLAARVLQGLGAGAQRMVTFSIVRDRHGGLELARVMSLAMTVLLLEPVAAPLFAQGLLLIGSWRWILGAVAAAGCLLLAWAGWRLEESLPEHLRRPISPASLADGFREVLRQRAAFAHMLAFGLAMGAHLGFLNSAQGIFQRTYGAGLAFTPLFSLVCLATAAASFANAHWVRRHGSPWLIRIGFGAQVCLNLPALGLAAAGALPLPAFVLLQACNMFAFGLLIPNLTAMAMHPLGHVAGTASSMFGFLTTTLGALLGYAVGQCFDGSLRPVLAGYVGLAAVALTMLSLVERRCQRQPRSDPPVRNSSARI